MTEFGPYDWCYLSGFKQACINLGIKNTTKGRNKLNSTIKEALHRFPVGWREEIEQNYDFETSNYSPKQFRKAFRREPMRLDKAAIAAMVLATYAELNGIDTNIWDVVSIRPAIFYLDNYGPYQYKLLMTFMSDDKNKFGLLQYTKQTVPAVFGDMANNLTVTYRTAELFREYIKNHTNLPLDLGLINPKISRPDGVRKKYPSRAEAVL